MTSPAPVYLLSGEPFLADDALERIRAEVGADPLSEVSFDASADPAAVRNALETSSLLGGRRLVIVRDAHDLRKDQADALVDYLQAPSPDSVLVLIASGRTKLDTAAKRSGTVVTLAAPRGRSLVGWIKQRGRAAGVTLDDRAAWGLIDSAGTELRDLDGALQQMATALGPGARVGAAEVRRLFPRLADERIYAFTDGVGERRLAVAMGSLRRLLEQGEHPLVLFGALVAHVRRMLLARRVAERGPKAVAEVVGWPDWRAERLARQALKYSENELVHALELLARTDVDMKSGDWVQPEIPLERAVVHIVSGQLTLTG